MNRNSSYYYYRIISLDNIKKIVYINIETRMSVSVLLIAESVFCTPGFIFL